MKLNEIKDDRLANTVFLVESNDNESFGLWEKWNKKVKWEEKRTVLFVEVGCINDDKHMPVCVNITWNTIQGKLVAFYYSTSRYVDYIMIENWFDKHCPMVCDNGKRKGKTNSANFHNCINAIEEK